ncbi:tetratricopeptide repeat protein [Lutibacter sp. Hel_I_33_5]|uniref:tetratricopeptide repeat protein n=1 Tax=Lutibacter sp. Hel_I_33_5 TaxID=1566289 RepID=UPI0011A608B1|nr:tetratricopeptide repeat protein [Lutibacter sp. Hel_I_33_5]TVZ56692.1 tetratricopeptide repeat protein [Lutibacter sp. Hel_I_33_5]
MEKLLKYCLSIIIALSINSCKKELTIKEKIIKSDEMINGGHYILGPYLQGSPKMMTYTEKAIALNPKNGDAWRELSIPYLKRGMPHKWKPLFDKAVLYDSTYWQPWRGYLYLWFYRDYKKAIVDFDASDILTPNFIDAPQGLSVDCWRGIAYLGLKDYKNSIDYFDKYIDKEIKDFSENSVDVTAFLYKGIAYFESKNLEKAEANFNRLLKNSYGFSADGKYYLALIYKEQGKINEAKTMIDDAIKDFNEGYYNKRPYVETLRQLYLDDFEALKLSLTKK